MASSDQERHIPYLPTAEAVVAVDNGPELYLRSLFPDATDEQVASFTLYTIAKFHEGIVQGLEIAGNDPINELEAYQLGVQEGLDRRDGL